MVIGLSSLYLFNEGLVVGRFARTEGAWCLTGAQVFPDAKSQPQAVHAAVHALLENGDTAHSDGVSTFTLKDVSEDSLSEAFRVRRWQALQRRTRLAWTMARHDTGAIGFAEMRRGERGAWLEPPPSVWSNFPSDQDRKEVVTAIAGQITAKIASRR